MKVLIVEDEYLASERLAELVKQYDDNIEIIESFETISDTINFFKGGGIADLVFMDIQLSDGKSFEIFEKAELNTPIIFTTAYDDFMLNAFKTNSVDYLLKPIHYKDLQFAIEKYKKLWLKQTQPKSYFSFDYQKLAAEINIGDKYKKRFLVKVGDKLKFIPISEISCFYADGKAVYLLENKGHKYIVDYTLEEIEQEYLKPDEFFRINRKFIIRLNAIKEIRTYVNSRLKLILFTNCEYDLIVSRDKVSEFKNWIDK